MIEYTLGIAGSSNNSGSLELTYMNISGRICADDWDEKDATVACRQMGYVKGKTTISVMVTVFVLTFENFILISLHIIIHFFIQKVCHTSIKSSLLRVRLSGLQK